MPLCWRTTGVDITTTVDVRSAHPSEASRLTQIAHAAKRHWGYPEDLISLWEEDLTLASEFIESHDVHCALIDGIVVGFYALSHVGDVFELEHMWVDPDRIGQGVGAVLFHHAVVTVRSHGGSRLDIVSDPNAEGFYKRMGARSVGTVRSKPDGRTLPLLILPVATSST